MLAFGCADGHCRKPSVKTVKIAASPIYLDTSALAKIYVPEPESDELDAALEGRRDLLVADLAITELTSALARRLREGDVTAAQAQRIYQRILRDIADGEFRRLDLTANTHREAERLLMSIGRRVPLRAADALHLALGITGGARTLITYDRRMVDAANAVGTFELPVTI